MELRPTLFEMFEEALDEVSGFTPLRLEVTVTMTGENGEKKVLEKIPLG